MRTSQRTRSRTQGGEVTNPPITLERRMKMKDVNMMMSELRAAQEKVRGITGELCRLVAQDEELLSHLRSGLVKLNFPTPSNFLKQVVFNRR